MAKDLEQKSKAQQQSTGPLLQSPIPHHPYFLIWENQEMENFNTAAKLQPQPKPLN
ncbi:MbeB family mobilization protein [Enterobacter hormaechei]